MPKSVFIKDANASKDLAIALYPFALHLAKTYHTGMDFDDDITSAAILGLVTAAELIKNGEATADNPKAYVRDHVRRNIIDTIVRRRTVHMSRSTYTRHKDDNTLEIIYDGTSKDRSVIDNLPANDPLYCIDTMDDFLQELQFSDSEMNVLKLRMEGKTVREVAECLTIEKSMVSLIIKAMKRRWKKWLRGE